MYLQMKVQMLEIEVQLRQQATLNTITLERAAILTYTTGAFLGQYLYV